MRLTLTAILLTAGGVTCPAAPVRAQSAPMAFETQNLSGGPRGETYSALAANWTPSRRAAFARLLVAEDAFATSVGDNETDRLSPGANIEARAAEHAAFLSLVKRVIRGATTPEQIDFEGADGALIATYAQVMAVQDTSNLAWGSVDKDGIARTQRMWLGYRDAFVVFAATFPGAADLVKTDLTQRRSMSLEDFLGD